MEMLFWLPTVITYILCPCIFQVHSASEFNYGETVGLSDYQENEIYENVAVIYDNMVTTYALLSTVQGELAGIQETTAETLTIVTEVNKTATDTLEILDMVQNPNAKFAGCDGWDQDQDDVADECDEDNFPPEILFNLGGGVRSIEETPAGQIKVSSDKIFASISEAKGFVSGMTTVTDDCAPTAALHKTIDYIGGTCDSSEFVAIPTHICQDSFTDGTATEKVGEGVVFLLNVDDKAPAVSCSVGENKDKTIFLEENGGMFNAQLLTEVVVSHHAVDLLCLSRMPL